MTPRAILTDIEGTTSSIAFVHKVLFPYARARIAEYVAQHADQVAPVLANIRALEGDLSEADCIAQLLAWQDADAKIGPLKALQGMIWAHGYGEGTLKGHIYPDAVAGLKRWHAQGITLAVYSSGSVPAQKLLFGHSEAGDLTPLFSGWFDTGVGGKKDAPSYRAIAEKLALPPADILFLSDVPAELDAAREAGLAVTLLARDGAPETCPYPLATSFDTILPESRS
ncbi:acireductone synthase [Novosphingobium rosa]|uniref:acireductone synthase n=1 Tax=Novosphingobium rosa TaxID=76978 RepID=UPI00082DE110|nr:acireductone synthase [Novosphingobium rosa]